MRSAIIALVMAVSVVSGCAAGPQGGTSYSTQGAAAGAALGGAVGGIVSSLIPEAAPFVRTLLPTGGAVVGGVAGFGIGKMKDNEQQEAQATLAAQKMQQEQMRRYVDKVRQETRLSAPVGVQVNGQYYYVTQPSQLADLLMQVPDGTMVSVLCNKKNQQIVAQDMAQNGLRLHGTPAKSGKDILMNFRKAGVLAPMTGDQISRLL